jgi:hypothetical protein
MLNHSINIRQDLHWRIQIEAAAGAQRKYQQ